MFCSDISSDVFFDIFSDISSDISSDRHVLRKHQFNCGDTDMSHRHVLCKHQYNCGAATQLDTLSGPLQTRSPLWRALRRTHKRLRTVANGCERLRPQRQNLANTASPPDPQVKREPSLRIREKDLFSTCEVINFIYGVLLFFLFFYSFLFSSL